jgi:hypothetical protein
MEANVRHPLCKITKMCGRIFQKAWVFLFFCTGCGPGLWLSTPDDALVQVGEIRSTVRLTSTAITWDASDYSSYLLVRSDTSTISYDLASQTSFDAGTALDSHATIVCSGTSTTCADTGLTAGTLYYYFVYGTTSSSGGYTLIAEGSARTGPILTDVMGGSPRQIAVSGNIAVMAQRSAGLIIADISALPTVTILSRYFNSNWFINTVVENSYIYAGNGDEGLTIIDIHDASAPTLVSNLTLGGSTSGLLKDGNLLYACNSAQGLLVIDVSTITSPQLVSATPMVTLCNTLQKSGSYLYAATRTDGLNIYSLAQPTSPALVLNVPTATSAVDVLVRGSYAYVSAGTGGVHIVDISTPASAAIVANLAALSSVNSVSASGNYLYVSDDTALRIVDASNPIALTQISTYPGMGPGSFYSARSGNYVLDSGTAFLEVVDVSTPASPVLAGSLPGGSSMFRLDYSNDFVSFAFSGAGALGGTIDSDGKFTQTLFISGYPSVPSGTFADSAYLYVTGAATTALAIFDRSLAAPTAIGTLTTGAAGPVFVEGNTAYIAQSGVRIVDVTNKASPTVLGTLAGGNITSLSKSGNYLYLTDSGGNLRVVNVSNPAAPTSQAVISLSTPSLGVVKDDLLVVARQSAGVSLFDISTPSSPSLLTTLTGIGDVRAVAFYDNYLFTAGYLTANICVFDVTNPGNPVQVAQVAAAATAVSFLFDEANETAIVGIRGGAAMSFKAMVP